MDQSCHRGSADIKECEEMLGDDSAAVHLSQHTENHQRVDRCAKTAAKCVFSFKKCSKPSGIHRIVRQEQTKHGDSDDLMRCFSHNGIAHQHGQCRRHRKVNARFDLLPAVHFFRSPNSPASCSPFLLPGRDPFELVRLQWRFLAAVHSWDRQRQVFDPDRTSRCPRV